MALPAKAAVAQAATVPTPATGTIAIQLTPAPFVSAPPLPWYSNPAIVVPVVTLLGVIATIWLGWWKTRKEMTASDAKWKVDRDDARLKTETDRVHAAEQARQARLVTARREVYLELIKEMTTASMALGGMPLQKSENLDVQAGFHGFLSAAARVAILGEMDTVVKSRELMTLVNDILYKKMPEIIEMRVILAEQAKFERIKEQQLAKSEAIKQIMTDFLKEGRLAEAEKWNIGLTESDTQATLYLEKVIKRKEEYAKLARAYQRSMIDDTAKIAEKTNQLIGCIRTELELSSNVAILKSTTQEMYDAAKKSIEELHTMYVA